MTTFFYWWHCESDTVYKTKKRVAQGLQVDEISKDMYNRLLFKYGEYDTPDKLIEI